MSIASTILRLTSKTPDVSGTITLQTYTLVKGIHAPVTNIEEDLILISQKIADLPEVGRRILIQ